MLQENPFIEIKSRVEEIDNETNTYNKIIKSLKIERDELVSKCTHKNEDGSKAIVKIGWDFGSDRNMYMCEICNTIM